MTDTPTAPDAQEDPAWLVIYERMQALKSLLANRGIVINLKDAMKPRYGIRYSVQVDGRRVQKTLHLGRDVALVRRARALLHEWQEQHRRTLFACSKDAHEILIQIPEAAGYGAPARAAYRRALRLAARDPNTLLDFLAGFDEQEAGFTGTKRLRSWNL